MAPTLADEPLLEADEIQGNSMRGFDSPYMDLLGFKIDRPDLARPWLAALGGRIASLASVHDHRLRRSAGDPATPTEVLVNAALSRYGLQALGFDGALFNEGFFNLAMGKLAGSLGDPITAQGQPANYVVGQDARNTPDLLLLIGCGDGPTLDKASGAWQTEAAAAGLRRIYGDRGNVLPGGVEHFGYRDGISGPGPRGLLPGNPPQPLTLRQIEPSDPAAPFFGKPGQPLVWPGQFVFGYPNQTDDPLVAGPLALGPDWSRNGSLLVFRRLRQDVRAFRNFVEAEAGDVTKTTGQTVTADQVGAQVVGRWQDGTPAILSPAQPDATLSGDDARVNHFAYGGIADVRMTSGAGVSRIVPGCPADETGLRCPQFAHIRKVNPRNQRTNQGAADSTLRFQMLRRGIPYGDPYAPGKEDADRGLLFLAYQTSFDHQFQILNRDWMNNSDAPESGGEGHDLLVGQAAGQRFGVLRDAASNERARLTTLQRWVIPTGGAFLFSPSLKFFRDLAPH